MIDPHAGTTLTPEELLLVEEREAITQESTGKKIDVVCRDVSSGVFREHETKK